MEWQFQIEYLPRVDLAVPDEVDQLGQKSPHRGGPTVQVNQAPEHLHPGDRDVVSDADEADVSARASRVDGLHHRLLCTDRFDHGMRAEAASELLDLGHTVLTALLDDVGRPVLARQILACVMAAHSNDPLRTKLFGCEHGMQTDRAVAYDGHRLARGGLRGHRTEPARPQHIGGREQARDELVGWEVRGRYEGAVGERD